MNEDQEVRISNLLDLAISRLEGEIQAQHPSQLPEIARAIIVLHGYRTGTLKGDEKHMLEINLLKNVNQTIKGFTEGGQNGNRKPPQ